MNDKYHDEREDVCKRIIDILELKNNEIISR